MRSTKAEQNELPLNVRLVPGLETAIDQWRAARYIFQSEPGSESLLAYNEATDDLEAAWGKRYPKDANAPGAFEQFRRSLIAAEDE